MPGKTLRHGNLTIAEYFELEAISDVRHEYVGGTIWTRGGETRVHNAIVLNIAAHLWQVAAETPCSVFTTSMKLHVAKDAIYYPDVMVACDPDDNDDLIVMNPCVVVEVLSDSTLDRDRREKVMTYRRMPHLQMYLIVWQDARRIERHFRDETGQWDQADLIGRGPVPFPCPEVVLTLDDIYANVPL